MLDEAAFGGATQVVPKGPPIRPRAGRARMAGSPSSLKKGIKPHIPVFDKSARRDGTFERADFVYDHADDSYICPGGKRLRQRRKLYREPRPFVDENGLMRYRASKLELRRLPP